jgi:hypothetical protein
MASACRDSVVGVATWYGLNGPRSIHGKGEIFLASPYRPWGQACLQYNEYRVSFSGVKRRGRGVDHPPLSSAEVKVRVELYPYSPSRSCGLF